MAGASRPEGVWGGAALRQVAASLARGWAPGLTVLTGDDHYHLDRAQAAILDQLVPDPADAFGLSVVGDEPITTQAIVGAARSAGMFAARRVVLLKDVASLEGDPEPLAAYAKKPPADSYLVVRAPKLDRKRKLHKALAEAGACLTFRLPASEREVVELVSEASGLARTRGLALEGDAAALLVDVCGHDLNRIASEIEKISIWQGTGEGGRVPVDAALIRDLVAGSTMLTGWELADALTRRDRPAALAAARRLLDAGDEPIKIVGGLASRARSLLRAKAMTERGAPAKDVVDEARAWYFREALAVGVRRYALAELLAMPARLLEADRTFKSRAIDKGAVLETLVARLTAGPEDR
jgi:DNA polymerase-3 subunit delta